MNAPTLGQNPELLDSMSRAAAEGNTQRVDTLIAMDVDTNAHTESLLTPLSAAVR